MKKSTSHGLSIPKAASWLQEIIHRPEKNPISGTSSLARHFSVLRTILATATIACGIAQTSALPAGSLVGWGDAFLGQDAVLSSLSTVTAVATGHSNALALKIDGTVVEWGAGSPYNQSAVPAGLANVVAISVGALHDLALKSDGTVVAWGNNGAGQTTVPAGLSSVVAIAAGAVHSLALKSDGTVVAWGDNSFGQSSVPPSLSGVVAIAAGAVHSLALTSDGTVVAWGNNGEGQTTVPAGLSGVVAIAGGSLHSLALKSDGTVVAWGFNASAVPAGLSGVTAIAADEASLALKSDGTVVAWGYNGPAPGPAAVPAGLSGVLGIATGHTHSFAIVPAQQPPIAFSGFLAPIQGADASGGSFESPVRTFKMGSTIPVKFTASLSDGSPVDTGVQTLTVTKYTSSTTFGTPIDATPQDAATTGDQFRSGSNGEWHFNLDTAATGMSLGIWYFIATLSDGTQHTAWIQLK